VKKLSDEQVKRLTTMGVWVGLGCVLLWLLYQYVWVGLYWGPRTQLSTQIAKLKKTNESNARLLSRAAQDSTLWAKMSVLNMKEDEDARDKTAQAVWEIFSQAAQQSGFTFISWVDNGTHPSTGRLDFQEIRFTASARTTTNRLAGFLYLVENTNQVPARVDSLNVHAQTPGNDDLHVEMVISALLYNPRVTMKPRPPLEIGTQPATRVSYPTTQGGRVRTPTTRPELAPPDPKKEAELVAKRLQEEQEAAKALAEREAFDKLSDEEKLQYLQRKREAEALAATRKAEEDKVKQEHAAEDAKKREEEMIRRRQQEMGGAATAPGGNP
jgi:hypothetical protein